MMPIHTQVAQLILIDIQVTNVQIDVTIPRGVKIGTDYTNKCQDWCYCIYDN